MTIATDQNILWLQISVQYLLAVEILKCRDNLSCVEDNIFLCEVTPFTQVVEERTSSFEVKDQVQLLCTLERVV